jgi:hypothetical protein
MRREVTHVLERWLSPQGDLRAQNAAYRLAWGMIIGVVTLVGNNTVNTILTIHSVDLAD